MKDWIKYYIGTGVDFWHDNYGNIGADCLEYVFEKFRIYVNQDELIEVSQFAFKPILKKLENITDEEIKTLYPDADKILRNSTHIIIRTYTDTGSSFFDCLWFNGENNEVPFGILVKLINLGYDVFNAIDQNLAIDVKTIKD